MSECTTFQNERNRITDYEAAETGEHSRRRKIDDITSNIKSSES